MTLNNGHLNKCAVTFSDQCRIVSSVVQLVALEVVVHWNT